MPGLSRRSARTCTDATLPTFLAISLSGSFRSPNRIALFGHASAQAGCWPWSMRCTHRLQASTVPLPRGTSGFWSCKGSCTKERALYGQAIMQYRQPIQRCLSTSTMPSARLKEAFVGHTSTQGGCSQCWHIIGSDSSRPLLTSLSSILRIHCESVDLRRVSRSESFAPSPACGRGLGRGERACPLVPPDKPFSLLQAATQSLQPSLHCVVSISIPQRTLPLTR